MSFRTIVRNLKRLALTAMHSPYAKRKRFLPTVEMTEREGLNDKWCATLQPPAQPND